MMKMPWANKTGLAKAAACFAALLLISLGLCGVNFVSVLAFVPLSGGDAPHGWRGALGSVLTVGAGLELIGIAVGLIGLIVVGLVYLGRAVLKRDLKKEGEPKP